ncbi:MAG: prolyl oligopeptidase family serine peptidase [Gemmataceae bacterium]
MRRMFAGLTLLGLSVAVWAAAPPAADFIPWTIEDVVEQEEATGFRLSPDGSHVLLVRSTANDEENGHVQQIHRIHLKTGREVQLTRGRHSCTSPCWSPDGRTIAFLSDRPAETKSSAKKTKTGKDDDDADETDTTQAWVMDASGGEPSAVTEGKRAVQHIAWATSDTLFFTAREALGRRESYLKQDRKDETTVVEDDANEPPVRLFRVDVTSKQVKRLSDNRDQIDQFAVAPGGKHVVALHSRSLRYTYDNKIKPIVELHDLKAGTRRRVLADPRLNISGLIWAPDGSGFYATNEHSSQPHLAQAGVTELWWFDLAAGQHRRLDLKWPRGLAGQYIDSAAPAIVPLHDGFLALLADGVRFRAARYTRQGKKLTRRWVKGRDAGHLVGLDATPDGATVVYAHSTAASPPRWFQARLRGANLRSPDLIVSANDLEKRRIARCEVVRWKGARNEEVEGLLFYPHGWQPGRPAPLVVQIHGGPAAADHDAWDENWAGSANLMCQRGAFVLRPNYHGSSSYGLAWLESIAGGRYCDLEPVDIEKGIDALITRGLVDPNRLALSGWSNGAILTNVLMTRSNRYRAAIVGAGSVEYVSDWSSCEFGEAFDRFYFGRSPLEDLSLYQRKSPFYQLQRVTTPTLILSGSEDRVVHPQQGWALYRALQQLGKAPVRFVLFPGEKHSLKKLASQRRKLEEELAWLDEHLFATTPVEGPLVKKEAPLAWLLHRGQARRVGSLFGVQQGKLLVPELVRHGKLWVGRFEVTRAQFARFQPNYRIEPGTENFPASGISFEEAQAYCAWLRRETGQPYRLPTETEADTLYEKPGDGDNTLDAWAGYTVNIDDAVRLREKLASLPQGTTLLREVGSGRGVGKPDLVYDLGGNVAEWVTTKKGKGVLRGGSADLPADRRGKGPEAGLGYRGFRLLLD